MKTLLNERMERGLLYSRTTRSLSKAKHIMRRMWIDLDMMAVLEGSLLTRT